MRVGVGDVMHNENGAVVLVVVLFMFTFLALVMLVVDVGGVLTKHRHMVRAADAAALATAQACARQLPQDPTSVATEYAVDNVEDAVLSGLDFSGDCNAESGSVTVTLQSPQTLFFAPVFGLADFLTVPARATAMWGPAGSATAVPLTIDAQKLNDCGIPGTDEAGCYFWYSHDEPSDSSVGWLDPETWNTPDGTPCSSNPGMEQWLVEGFPTPPLNWPSSTNVCRAEGDWAVLDELIDSAPEGDLVRLLPVHEPNTSSSNKYNVVSFVSLALVAVYDGDDPRSVGLAPIPEILRAEGHCTFEKPSFTQGETLTLDFVSGDGCPNGKSPDTIIPDDPFVYDITDDEETPYSGCAEAGPGCDYLWDASTHQITWLGEDQPNVWIEFDWSKEGQQGQDFPPGACGKDGKGPGEVPADAEDKCLVTTWAGLVSAGSNPVGGADFGVRPVRLCEAPDCPST